MLENSENISQLFKAPYHGATIELHEVCESITDCHHSTPKYLEEGKLVIRSNNIKGGRLLLSNVSYTDREHFEQRTARAKPASGDLIITREAPMGEVCIIPDGLECCLGQRMVLIKPDPFKIDKKYLLYALMSEFTQIQIGKSQGTGSIVSNLRIPLLKELNIPSISLEKQKQIGLTLGNIDAKIELNNKINAELEGMAKLIYDYWFVQFNFPDKNGKPYKTSGGKMVYNQDLKREIPEGWEVKEFGQVLNQVNESIEPNEYPELKYLPIDKLPSKKLYYQDYEVREEANSSLIRFQENDILIGAMRVYFHRVCNAIEDGISRSTMMVLRPVNLNHKSYLLFALNRNETIDFAIKNSTGSSIPYAKWNHGLEKYKICIPETKDLLFKFNKIVNPTLEKFKILSKQNQKLSELRDWLLPMLMNGQVRVE